MHLIRDTLDGQTEFEINFKVNILDAPRKKTLVVTNTKTGLFEFRRDGQVLIFSNKEGSGNWQD